MRFFLFAVFFFSICSSHAQRVESIHFHLYTDSLKKGTHNYINVDGKMSDGSWKPLTAKELDLKTDYGKFEGNDLVLPDNPNVSKVTVTASLKSDKDKTKQIVIWIKQKPDPPLTGDSGSQRKRYR
ncbi:hypothetical protein ACTJIJ_02560 [Niabella sp. 22666]|uniref:hypothetical protein n=1 Tax=Niabella sp. 22666 TaxID=3453954 RepID=UPI003F84DCD4